VDPKGIEPLPVECKTTVLPLSLKAHCVMYRITFDRCCQPPVPEVDAELHGGRHNWRMLEDSNPYCLAAISPFERL
jgi:hypothetical protein